MVGYPGGKGGEGVYQQIINLIPPHRFYVEPFLGGGAIMSKKRTADIDIGGDASAEVLRDYAASRPGECVVHDMFSDGAIRPGKVNLYQGDGIDLIRAYCFRHHTDQTFFYVDPPYLFSTRSSDRPIYEHEMGDDAAHERLLKLLVQCVGPVMVSGYWSELYADYLIGWETHSFTAMTRGGPKTEWLWMNYPRPTQLHDYRYLGANFRERERIKRKKNRMVKKLGNMPAQERLAMMWAVEEAGLL